MAALTPVRGGHDDVIQRQPQSAVSSFFGRLSSVVVNTIPFASRLLPSTPAAASTPIGAGTGNRCGNDLRLGCLMPGAAP
jgi:hypothetical protein